MLAPYPDVIMLLQSEEARQKDPLGLFGKGLDVSAVLIGSISLGISIDDTISVILLESVVNS